MSRSARIATLAVAALSIVLGLTAVLTSRPDRRPESVGADPAAPATPGPESAAGLVRTTASPAASLEPAANQAGGRTPAEAPQNGSSGAAVWLDGLIELPEGHAGRGAHRAHLRRRDRAPDGRGRRDLPGRLRARDRARLVRPRRALAPSGGVALVRVRPARDRGERRADRAAAGARRTDRRTGDACFRRGRRGARRRRGRPARVRAGRRVVLDELVPGTRRGRRRSDLRGERAARGRGVRGGARPPGALPLRARGRHARPGPHDRGDPRGSSRGPGRRAGRRRERRGRGERRAGRHRDQGLLGRRGAYRHERRGRCVRGRGDHAGRPADRRRRPDLDPRPPRRGLGRRRRRRRGPRAGPRARRADRRPGARPRWRSGGRRDGRAGRRFARGGDDLRLRGWSSPALS